MIETFDIGCVHVTLPTACNLLIDLKGPVCTWASPYLWRRAVGSHPGYDGLLETISKPSKMWLTFLWTQPINKGLDCIDLSLWSPELYSAFINSFPFLNRNNGWLVNYFYKIPKVCQSYKHAILELCLLLKINYLVASMLMDLKRYRISENQQYENNFWAITLNKTV